MGRRARELAAALARVQDVLGEHQDAVVADTWLAKTAPECSPPEAYALGMLAEIERELAVRARAGLASAWDAARTRRLRAWM
jgi:CHAD domain-containing protein